MTRRVTLDLARLLPGVPEGDACVDRLAQALRSRPGISLAAKDRDGATAALAVTFEDRDISEADVVEAARRAAARLMAAFRHEQLRLGGLDCDECARAIEHVMARVDGIRSVAVDYPSETLSVEYEAAHLRRPQIRRRIEALGYTVEEGRSLSSWLREHRHLVRAAVAGAMALAARALEPAGIPSTWGYAAACVVAGWPTAVEAVSSLRQRRLDVDLLMLLAAVGAAATGQLAEGAVLLVLFAFGHALEHEAEGRARGAIVALGRLVPRFARRLDPRGESTDVLVHALARGDRVLLRPGERIPVDGEVLRGESLVDESAVTGESTPVAKGPGAPVFAGTLNGDGTLEVAVTRLSSESTIARMTRLVEEARSSAAPAEQAARRLAGVLVPTVLAGAAAVATLPPLLGWLPWQESLYRAMALLVAASPCALAIGPPVAGVAALARAARHGILVKGAAHLEAAARLRAIAFDKTGTLTQGRPVVEAIEVFPGGPVDGAPGLLAWAAAAESSSTHPLAASVVAAARAHGIDWPTPSQVTAYPGRGVEAVVEGRCIRVGTAQWAAPSSASERAGSRHDLPAGTTEVIVSVDGRPAGALYLSDPLRPEAAEAVASLKALGLVHTALLSGDRAEVARRIGAAVGIDEVHAPLMPEEKLRALAVLEHRFGAVAMVGDGVNDGPALAAATVGIAMGAAGSDVALEAAPAALLGTDLRLLARLVRLARATRRILVQDLALAMGVIAVLSAAAVTGYAGIGPAVAIHEASTVVVALNGLRLLGPGGLPQPSRLRTPVSRTSPTGFIR